MHCRPNSKTIKFKSLSTVGSQIHDLQNGGCSRIAVTNVGRGSGTRESGGHAPLDN